MASEATGAEFLRSVMAQDVQSQVPHVTQLLSSPAQNSLNQSVMRTSRADTLSIDGHIY